MEIYGDHKKGKPDYAIHFDISNVTITYDLARYIYGKFKAGKSFKIVVIEKDYKIIKLSSSDNYQDIVKMTNYLKATKD